MCPHKHSFICWGVYVYITQLHTHVDMSICAYGNKHVCIHKGVAKYLYMCKRTDSVFNAVLLGTFFSSTNCRIRKENFARAIEHESNGNSAAAYECYQKAVDISPSIAHGLIQVRNRTRINYTTYIIFWDRPGFNYLL